MNLSKIPEKQNFLPGFSQQGDSLDPLYLRTYKEVADFFGNHTQTVKNWVKKGMPIAARGKYDANAIRKWAIAENLIYDDGIGYSAKIQKEKYLHERAKRKEREFELAIKHRKYIKIENSKRELITLAQQVRMTILALPHKMAPILEGLNAVEIQRKLEAAIDDILRHLSGIKND